MLLEDRERQRQRLQAMQAPAQARAAGQVQALAPVPRFRDYGYHRVGIAIADDEPAAPPPPYNPAPARAVNAAEFDWLTDPSTTLYSRAISFSKLRGLCHLAVVCTRHAYTTSMVRSLRCAYCNVPVDSVRDLQHHLSRTRHPVYACCGRLFRNDVNFGKHIDARTRFGQHIHQIRRD